MEIPGDFLALERPDVPISVGGTVLAGQDLLLLAGRDGITGGRRRAVSPGLFMLAGETLGKWEGMEVTEWDEGRGSLR